MTRPRTALNSQTLPGLSGPAVVELAARSGFQEVELAGNLLEADLQGVIRATRRAGVKVIGTCPTTALHHWHWGWDDAVAHQLDTELGWASELGADYFVMPFMQQGGGSKTVTSALERALSVASTRPIQLAVEPIGHHDVLRRADQLAPVLRAFDTTRVGLLLDAFHFFRAGNTLADLTLYDGIEILGLQLSNANSLPTDELIGYRDRTFPLDGRFPVVELTQAVIAARPQVPIIVEVIGTVVAGLHGGAAAKRAEEQIETILQKLILQENLHD